MPLRTGKKAIGCRWVFTVKFNPDGFLLDFRPVLLLRVMLKLMELITLVHFLLSQS